MGRKVGIDRSAVVAAARDIADEGGLEAVTLASVAGRLGIRSPSLYAHVEGLNGLRRLLAMEGARSLARSLTDAAEGHQGSDALRELAVAYRSFARRHPGSYASVQRAVKPGEDDDLYGALAEVAAPAIRALDEAGVAPLEQVHLTRAFRSALHGFVVLEQAGGFGMPESVDESFRRLVDLLVLAVQATGSGQSDVEEK